MNIKKYRLCIIIPAIIMVGMIIVWLATNNANQTSAETVEKATSDEEAIIVEETFDSEEISEQEFTLSFAEELARVKEREAEEGLTIEKIFSQINTLPSELITPDLKLFGYYAILINSDLLDILTENDVQAIITELKQFQPKEIAKLLHHHEEMLIYANNISIESRSSRTEKYGYLSNDYVSYQADDGWSYKIEFSPTIDKILLRITKTRLDIGIYYEERFASNPLFMELADTKNNNIIPLIQFFLDSGADINAKNPTWGRTIFSYVGTLEIAQFLLAHGADSNIVTNNGETPLINVIRWNRSNELIKFLIDIGGDLHAKSSYTVLETAKREVEIFKFGYANMLEDEGEFDDSDFNEQSADIKKAEEVVRIIEQALADEAK